MSKVLAFYKEAEQNPTIKEELLTLDEKYKSRMEERNIRAIIEAEIITIAAKYNHVLTKDDFADLPNGELDEDKLENVAGGLTSVTSDLTSISCITFGFPRVGVS